MDLDALELNVRSWRGTVPMPADVVRELIALARRAEVAEAEPLDREPPLHCCLSAIARAEAAERRAEKYREALERIAAYTREHWQEGASPIDNGILSHVAALVSEDR